MTDHSHGLAALLDSARRRQLGQLIAEQSGVALGAALAGAVLLLLLGTQILDWYWLAALFLVSLAIGLWRTLRRVPSRYRLAQIIDDRLNLHDTLSTAFFYQTGQRAGDPSVVQAQRRKAEIMATSLSAAQVFPLRMPRVLYAVGGIALVAFGMFAIRYGVTRSLDLKPSLVKIAFDTFWKQDVPATAQKKPPLQRAIEEQLKKLGINAGSQENEAKQQESIPESAMNTVSVPEANAEAGDNAQAKVNSAASEKDPGDGESPAKGEKASGSEDPNGNDQDADGAAQGKQDAGQKNADDSKNDKSGMMDRMRDALSNLLNKLKTQPKAGENQQMAKDSKGGAKGQQSQKGAPSPGKPDSSDRSGSPDQQGEQQAQGEKTSSTQGKGGDKSADRQSQDAKSGIGKDDGDKSAREAEQLAAMGKISEILGKRQQNLSGELMVEVVGGNQQLKTAYSSNTGKHAEAGGEITRDEVPLIYRDFVQQYFAQIRKAPAASAGKSKIEAAPAPAKKTE